MRMGKPKPRWSQSKTTNLLERAFEEVRRGRLREYLTIGRVWIRIMFPVLFRTTITKPQYIA
jgi:hypothetical protein